MNTLGNLKRLEAALESTAPKKGPDCQVSVMLAALDDDERQIVQGWLHTESGLQHSHLKRTFSELGFDIGAGTISRHRKGDCHCDR